MTKKVLCLMLCVALVLPTCIIPAAGVTSLGYTIEDGIQYAFDGGSNTDRNPTWSQGYTWVLNREESGNMYCTLGAAEGNGHHVALDGLNGYLEKNKILTFDVRCETENAATLRILQYNNNSSSDQYDKKLNIKLYNLTKDQWYSYKIDTKDGIATNEVKVYRKLRDSDAGYSLLTSGTDYADAGGGISANQAIYLSLMDVTDAHINNAQYSFDNIMIADSGKIIADQTTFEVGNEKVTTVPLTGDITPVFATKGDTKDEGLVAITAVYDAAGNKVSVEKKNISPLAGFSRVKAPVVSAATIPQGGRIEAMLWSSESTMQPIAPLSVLGDAATVEASTATNLTYSAKANEITVEGKYDAAADVTLKVVDGSDIVYATQFKATSDGSFKKVLPINYDGNVTVSVSALGEDAESSGAIAMLNNWAAFKTAFENLDKDSADEFFADYADNFIVNNNGTETDLLDGVTLNAEAMSNIGYLKSIKSYSANMTYGEIVDEVVKIATEDVEDVNDFMSDFAAAKTLSTTNMPQAVEDMKTLLLNATFLTFDRTSDIICITLLSSDATDIESFWTDYVAAKDAQATVEATQIPGKFAGIADSAAMEAFFNQTIEISGIDYTITETLGLTSRLSGYTDKDYAVMYGAYSELYTGYTAGTPYSDISTAIEFLVDYTDEYRTWSEEIASKDTASAEWTSIKKAFGTLEFVTAELADSYAFANATNEEKIYKRIDDMGYASLEDAQADLTNADAKIACLTALGAATTANEIKTQIELAKNNGWITLGAVSDSGYQRMVGFGYDYFENIASAYEFATGPDYAKYLIQDGTSAEISFSDFSDQSLIVRQEMTEGENTFYRLTPDNIGLSSTGNFPYGVIGSGDNTNIAAPNSVIELDVRFVEKGLPLSLVFPQAIGGEDTILAIGLVPRETGIWYTYKIELGGYTSNNNIYDFLTVSVKERDNQASQYQVLSNSADIRANSTLTKSEIYGYDYTCRLFWKGSSTEMWVGYTAFRYGGADWTTDIFNATVTDIGPVMKAYQQAYIATSAAFEDAQGTALTRVPASGNVTPVFTVKNTGNACFVDVVTVVYDKNGNMVDYKCEVRTVAKGEGTEISGPSVDAANAAGGGRIEAFVVDKADRMRPIGVAVLGTQPAAGTSELTDVTYSTYANKVTVEGTKTANEKLVLTVKDLSGNVLAVTVFDAGNDGKFKNTVAINPERYTSGTQVKVMLSTVSGKEEETINMSSGFNAMKTALNSSASDIEGSFFDDFSSCFSYFDNEGTVKYALEVAPENKADMAFLVNTFKKAKAFEGMTNEEIIAKLIEINGEIVNGNVAQFISDMNGASDPEVKETLLTSQETAKFIAFDLTGVSNVGAIATNMDTSGNTVQTIYNAFETAKETQKTDESYLIGGFKNIANGTEMYNFFANETNRSTLGITDVYSNDDAAVMYSVYGQLGYDESSFDSADAAEVVEAIKFVQNYVNEYKAWTSAINSSQTATAEWNAIKEVFGTLDFVTPALVDGNKAEERVAKVYKRIVDLYPAASARSASVSTLVEVASRLDDDLSVIEEKLACIDATAQAATTPNGEITGYWGRVKEQVVLASTTKGWITLNGSQGAYDDAVYNKMLGKSYRYFSEIVDAYNAAIPSGGAGGGNGGGGGTGGGGTGGGGTGGGGITSGTGNSLADIPDNITIVDGTTGNTGVNTGVNSQDYPVAPFVDVTDEYNWAEASISGLRQYGIIRGDGDGNFRPGDGISREEFLALLLRIFEIETKETKANFSDVKKSEWYYSTVATAYEMGIVNGYTDGRFGIGDKISRADMSVMVCRTLDIMGKAPDAENVGFVFTDYLEIPDYAYNAVARLQQMGLVKGDSYRRFNPTVNLTRAEAAVVLWPIFKQAGDMIQ